jgi:surfeit locus 1 family protein
VTRRPSANWIGRAAIVAALIVAAGGFAMLGKWQLRRADEHREIQQRFVQAGEQPVVTALPATDDPAAHYRRVVLRGHYVPGPSVLLDNMTHDGVAGYQILTPFEADDGTAWLMVNRGWVRGNPDRRVLPDVAPAKAPGSVRGRIAPWSVPPIRLGSGAAAAAGPQLLLMPYATTSALESALAHRVYPYQLLLDPDAPSGYTRQWRPVTMSPERNLAYAGQWFIFTVAALSAAVFIAIRSGRRGEER